MLTEDYKSYIISHIYFLGKTIFMHIEEEKHILLLSRQPFTYIWGIAAEKPGQTAVDRVCVYI